MKKVVRVIIYDPSRGVLMGRRNKKDDGYKKLALFGGKPEGDESIEDSAIREIKEELGIDIKPVFFHEEVDSRHDVKKEPWLVTSFVSQFIEQPIVLDQREHSEVVFVSKDNLKKSDIAFNHHELLTKFFKTLS